MKKSYVYILASKKNGTLYIGVTSNIARRISQHKAGSLGGFSKKYKVSTLVYCEIYDNILTAISREKQLKNWHRDWKLELIQKANPDWKDLYDTLI